MIVVMVSIQVGGSLDKDRIEGKDEEALAVVMFATNHLFVTRMGSRGCRSWKALI